MGSEQLLGDPDAEGGGTRSGGLPGGGGTGSQGRQSALPSASLLQARRRAGQRGTPACDRLRDAPGLRASLSAGGPGSSTLHPGCFQEGPAPGSQGASQSQGQPEPRPHSQGHKAKQGTRAPPKKRTEASGQRHLLGSAGPDPCLHWERFQKPVMTPGPSHCPRMQSTGVGGSITQQWTRVMPLSRSLEHRDTREPAPGPLASPSGPPGLTSQASRTTGPARAASTLGRPQQTLWVDTACRGPRLGPRGTWSKAQGLHCLNPDHGPRTPYLRAPLTACLASGPPRSPGLAQGPPGRGAAGSVPAHPAPP